MVTTTIPVAGVVKVPIVEAIIAISVCPTPFAVSNSRPLGRAGQQVDGLQAGFEGAADVIGLHGAEPLQVDVLVRGVGLLPDDPHVEHPAPGDRRQDTRPDAVRGLAEVAGEGGCEHVLEAGRAEPVLGLELCVTLDQRRALPEQLGERRLDLR